MASEDESPVVNTPEDNLTTHIKGIVDALASRGCLDLTSSIKLSSPGDRPCAGGGFCDVYRGELQAGKKIAIKALRVYESSSLGGNNEALKALKNTANEIYHWSKLSHPNVLPLLGLAVFKGYLSMISEWMDNGNLTSYLEQNPEADRIRLCMDVCAGLSYIHTRGMVHGDLKGANVLVSPDGVAMIADFGNAQLRDLTLKFSNTPNTGFSIRWAAPELLEAPLELLEDFTPQVSMEADVYAYGMTVLEALTGKLPYYWARTDAQVLNLIMVKQMLPPRPDIAIPDDLWEVLTSCWARVPSERPKITSIGKRLGGLVLSDEDVVRRATSIEEVIGALTRRGCPDLTSAINLTATSQYPFAGGEFGDVYRGALHDGTKIAIKTFRDYENSKPEERRSDRKALKRTARELYLRSNLKHRNVLPLMGLAVFRDDTTIITEWVENGSLPIFLRLKPETDRIRLCMDICSGLSYIHSNGMIHGDLKGANIMISPDGTAMIAGFGSARLQDATLDLTSIEYYGISVRWAAPELLPDDPRTSIEADVYAYGMTALETLTGKAPYEGINDYRVLVLKLRHVAPPRPDMIPDSLWELLSSCWTPEPSQRLEVASISDRLKALSLFLGPSPPRPNTIVHLYDAFSLGREVADLKH